ncbi:chemotaxis protein CheB [Novosphingobium aquimarinum]|uniref:chemotaxis protein CheB n=1 Tax=Novosphingobium aquimarinum TaxID=2682494 RepID=UPI0012EB0BD2|nr:chemotaxis protein CheB [Novosphingobium aquimarinum]
MSRFDHPVVAVGASAGGIEALKGFVEHIPAETNASFVILQHLAPDHESQLTEILDRAAHLPVIEASENMAVEPGRIYVLGPNRYLTIVDHGLFTEPPTEPRGLRMPIDHFMRSLADAAGEQSVGVILSGTGSDGTLGLRAIKGAGGVAMVQSPDTSLYSGMPQAAIDAGVVDTVGSIDNLCEIIVDLTERSTDPADQSGFDRTNALKYGALSVQSGKVSINWRVLRGGNEQHLQFDWVERGGPSVQPPRSRGFGSTVIERILRSQLLAESEIRYEEAGLEVHCRFPMSRLTGSDNVLAKARTDGAIDLERLRGAKVMVLDDEWLVAEQTAQYLTDAGVEIIGPYFSLEEAMERARTDSVDLAVLDYNIDGSPVTPLVEEFQKSDIPVILVSGYGSHLDLPLGTLGVDFMPKPVSGTALIDRVARRLTARGDNQSAAFETAK